MVEWKFDLSEERTINHVYFTIKRRQKSKYWTVLYIPVSVRTKATTAPVARLKPATQVFTPITKSLNKKYLQFYKEIHWQWSRSFKSIFIDKLKGSRKKDQFLKNENNFPCSNSFIDFILWITKPRPFMWWGENMRW